MLHSILRAFGMIDLRTLNNYYTFTFTRREDHLMIINPVLIDVNYNFAGELIVI